MGYGPYTIFIYLLTYYFRFRSGTRVPVVLPDGYLVINYPDTPALVMWVMLPERLSDVFRTQSSVAHWKLSPHENGMRMRPKLVPNLKFDPHLEASRLRDNEGDELIMPEML